MGCKVSKIDSDRGKLHMREVVSAKNAFASALSDYAGILKLVGAALCHYADDLAPPPSAPCDSSPPPPPPPPISPSATPMKPLPRFNSNIESAKTRPTDYFEQSSPSNVEESHTEEEFDQYEDSSVDFARSSVADDHQETDQEEGSRVVDHHDDDGRFSSALDDHFRKASESVHELSKLMAAVDAKKTNYNESNSDHEYIDYSAKVMKIITWNSKHGTDHRDEEDDQPETHGAVLDKLLVWEKKLYDESKAFLPMQTEFDRLKRCTDNKVSLEKAKADLHRFFPSYDMNKQLLESTVVELKAVRDKQLYPQLVDLVCMMTAMWEAMLMHANQLILAAKSLDTADESDDPVKNTSKNDRDRTRALLGVVEEWQLQLDRLVGSQKKYVGSLNKWLKQKVEPFETVPKERVIPPVQKLLQKWDVELALLPDEAAKNAVGSFAEVLNAVIHLQEREMEMKVKYEERRKEYENFVELIRDQNGAVEEETTNAQQNGAVVEETESALQNGVNSLKKKMEDALLKHENACKKVRKESVESLKNGLPELFGAMSGYARASCYAYRSLRLLAESLNQN